jgi:mannose/cellobiose epimerase-like protein (N-acyl-D-glucosamine 2-epimerase family)
MRDGAGRQIVNPNVVLGPAAERAYAALRRWIFQDVLPFWSTTGRDRPGFGFVEHLDPAARAADVPYKRVRVQARQIFVFSCARALGWPGALEAATDGHDFLTRHARRADGAWVRLLGRDGDVLDSTADLYDLAFVLFALAWYARATGSAQALDQAYGTLAWIERNMTSPAGGFHEAVPVPPEPRRQNPHMHLLEAVLALFVTTRDAALLATADALVDLFRRRFFDPATGSLGEFFTDDWQWAPGAAGTHVEPGHHYEWVWLLSQYERLSGRTVEPERSVLYTFANRWGCDAKTGLVLDVVDRSGTVRDGGSRIWPQTEAIKAHLVMADGAEVARIIDNLFDHFVAGNRAGTWTEHLAPDGTRKSDRIPASTLYHVVSAFSELERTFG